MPRFEPRAPTGSPSPLSPATLEVLRRLGGRAGGLLVLTGDDRVARNNLLSAVATRAEEMHLRSVRLRAHPLDEGVPYGALQPWFASWFRRPTAGPEPSWTGLDRSFFTFMAGWVPAAEPLGGPTGPQGTPPLGRELPAFSPVAAVAGAPPAVTRASSAIDPEVDRIPGPLAPRALDPMEMRAKLFEMIHGPTEEEPTVVCVGDAEYLDPASREWFSFLSGRLPSLPLVVVLSLEPRSEGFGTWKRQLASVSTTWDGWPPPGSRRRGEPRTADRVGKLSAEARQVLALVALAGPDATTTLLAATLGWSAARVDEALAPALEAGWVGRDGGRWTLEDPVLYPDLDGTLSRPDMNGLRRSLARKLEATAGGTQGPVLFRLAQHWAATGESAKAVKALMEGSREAEKWGSPELVESLLARALSISQSDPTSTGRELEQELYVQLARSRKESDDIPGSIDAYERAISLAQERKVRPSEWAPYVVGLARAKTLLGEDPEVMLKSTLRRLEGQSPALEAALLDGLGYHYRERNRREEGAEACERACELADREGDPVLRSRTHNDAAAFYVFGGGASDGARAREHAERALQELPRLELMDASHAEACACDVLSWVDLADGDHRTAVAHGRRALKAARRAGFRGILLEVLGNQSEVALEAGDLAGARTLSSELREQCDRYGMDDSNDNRQLSLFLEARVALARGQGDSARQQFERLIPPCEKSSNWVLIAQAYAFLVVIAAEDGNARAARGYRGRMRAHGLRASLPRFTLRHLEQAELKLALGPE